MPSLGKVGLNAHAQIGVPGREGGVLPVPSFLHKTNGHTGRELNVKAGLANVLGNQVGSQRWGNTHVTLQVKGVVCRQVQTRTPTTKPPPPGL